MMKRRCLRVEGELFLEFLVHDGDRTGRDWNVVVANAVGDDGYLVQERIVAPTSKADEVLQRVADRNLSRSTRPLVLTGHEHLPVQYSGVVVKPGAARIERVAGAVKITMDGLDLLFSEPIYSPLPFVEDGFHTAFLKVGERLSAANMREIDIARTWLFMGDIARDYEQLRQARKRYFSTQQIDPTVFLPASTGIQGVSPQRHHLIIDFWACSGDKASKVREISPLQCEPTQYEVLFSRVVRVSFPQDDLLLISGTASINEGGETVHRQDCDQQMRQTLAVLEAILRHNEAEFENVVQAIIYVQREEDLPLCLKIARERGFPVHRSLVYIADVCREDLLCEIEAHAVIGKRGE